LAEGLTEVTEQYDWTFRLCYVSIPLDGYDPFIHVLADHQAAFSASSHTLIVVMGIDDMDKLVRVELS